jgi:hypothetical protein
MKKILALVLALCMVSRAVRLRLPRLPTLHAAPDRLPPPPAGTDTNTVAVGAVIIARDDVPTDEIYTFVKTIFDNASTIAGQHAKGKELDLKFASSVTSVPYHPGAAKYFEEKGIKSPPSRTAPAPAIPPL